MYQSKPEMVKLIISLGLKKIIFISSVFLLFHHCNMKIIIQLCTNAFFFFNHQQLLQTTCIIYSYFNKTTTTFNHKSLCPWCNDEVLPENKLSTNVSNIKLHESVPQVHTHIYEYMVWCIKYPIHIHTYRYMDVFTYIYKM